MSTVLFISVIIAIALAIKLLLKYSIETSIFTAVCGITIIIAACALLDILRISAIIIYAISVASALYFIVYLILNPKNIKTTLNEIFTPGMTMFIFMSIIYYIIIKDKVMIHDDEAGAWAHQVKVMFMSNSYYKQMDHNHILGFFTLFNMKAAGFHEYNFFYSLWIVKWSALLITMKNLKWNKWYIVLLFAIGSLGIIYISPGFEPSYYMDIPLGIVAGSIAVSWSLGSITRKDYIWLFAGIIVLVNIKNELGAVIAILVSVFCVLCNVIRYFQKEKSSPKIKPLDWFLNVGILTLTIAFVLFSSSIISIISNIFSVSGNTMLVVLVLIFLSAISIIFFFRSKILSFIIKHKKSIAISSIIVLVLLAMSAFTIIYNISNIDNWRRVELVIYRLRSEEFFGLPAYLLFLIEITLTAAAGILFFKKNASKTFVMQSILILLIVIIFSMALAAGFILTLEESFNHMMLSFKRYYTNIIVLSAIWFLAKLLRMDNEYKIKHASIVVGLVITVFLINHVSLIQTTILANLEPDRYTFTYKLRPDLKEQAEFIRENTDKDNVLIISSVKNSKWDPFTVSLWMHYELLPMSSRGYVIKGKEEYHHTSMNKEITAESLKDYLEEKSIKYVYFYSKDEYIEEILFDIMEPSEINNSLLYKVTPNEQYLLSLDKIKE